MTFIRQLDLSRLRVYPLSKRRNLTQIEDVLIMPDDPLPPLENQQRKFVNVVANQLNQARDRGSTNLLIYGAHLIRNGTSILLNDLIKNGWITHLATNGAGSIHDWEFAHLGATSESVREGVANGYFGAWDETSTNIYLAILNGSLDSLGYGQSLGRLICDNGCNLPSEGNLIDAIKKNPDDSLTSARADLLNVIQKFSLRPGLHNVDHPYSDASVVASAWRNKVPLSVHPGIGYDIISNHPMFCGSAIGRAAEFDFKLFGGSLEKISGGVTLSIGSAIMGPQVFEKALSCVNNLRLQDGHSAITDHSIYVVDLQDGGRWNWNQGEPPKTSPAYYLRFCKSYSRMGGKMEYSQCDNATFIQHLHRVLIGR